MGHCRTLTYFQPRSCDGLEGPRVGRALLATVAARVDAARDQSAGIGVEASRYGNGSARAGLLSCALR
jgi:hypothetical protein